MASYQQTDEDFEDGILRDGKKIRVPLHLMDAVQREVMDNASNKPKITDGTSNSLGLHRPGYRMLADTKRNMSHYDTYDRIKADEYKNPPTGAGEHGQIGLREGDTCMTGGHEAGHIRRVNGQFVCVADPHPSPRGVDASDGGQTYRQMMDELYRLRDIEDANAYRTDGRKTRRLNAKGQEEGTFETEPDDDDDDDEKDRR